MTDAADGTDGTDAADPADPLFARRPVRGTSRVICFSPDHNLTLPLLPAGGVAAVIDCWADEVEALGKRFGWVQVFENKGAEMGCSNPHPHGQIWAQDELPTEAAKEDWHLAEYRRRSGGNLLVDYALRELEAGERIVEAGDDWVVLVPYWATWPFETLLLPLAPVEHLHALGGRQKATLARMLRRLLSRYDNLFECSFPYSMGWHGSPFGRDAAAHWQLHAHVYPPLLRSADVRKFMVGYEMLAEPQRDLKPETAAQMLREQSPVHYRSA
jgi:UDPglucose--hexose-1-phosphate uridylyltransferase